LANGRRLVERLPAFFLLEQVGDDVSASGETDPVALDLRYKPSRHEVMMLFMANSAVGADQLDSVPFDAINGAKVDAVGADHFHMLTYVLEAAHNLLLVGYRLNASLGPGVQLALDRHPIRLRLFET
jgi:hypothetical protein